MQVVHDSRRLLGHQLRETVFGSIAGEIDRRSRRQQSLQRRSRKKPVLFPAFFSDGNRNLPGRTTVRPKTAETGLSQADTSSRTRACSGYEQDK
jgi:hypothetical protein